MAKAWMPGVERIDGGRDRTVAGVGAPRAVWTVTGSDPHVWSATDEARRLIHEGRTAHLVWNPVSGEIVQLLAATRRAGMPLGGAGTEGHRRDPGDEGRVCVVVAVVGTEKEPFTGGPMVGRSAILDWLDSWEVSRRWPAGPPGRQGAEGAETAESARVWSRGGHFGHDQVPGATSTAPGRISPERVLSEGDGPTGPRAAEQGPGALTDDARVSRTHHGPRPSVIT
ncbi:hypothetical protein [Nocardiopsis sp. MG754419]|uniref:hypothetical protein n=1 Tax=Nocardiopsis sp. MG754419 TaxID=2259865 RepID=UPI001BA69BCA|nr:hypothetical protein [Nocardiopsis sp. MG754419]MBR8744296.1 hypothetical protein [Nocardiopsis sp. MG754419]